MKASCCPSSDPAETSAPRCPVSGGQGQGVSWTTVAALAKQPLPGEQRVWLCPDAACEVVYFGERGLEFGVQDVHVAPGHKVGSTGLACYCFDHSRQAIEDEVLRLGVSPTVDGIRREVQEKSCECEVRNPSGKCCLGEIREAIAGLGKSFQVAK